MVMQIYRVTLDFGKLLLDRNVYKVQSAACKKLEHNGLFSSGKVYSVKVTSTLPNTM